MERVIPAHYAVTLLSCSFSESFEIDSGSSCSFHRVSGGMFEKEGFNEMYKIVCSMMSRPESLAFRAPVDWKGLGLVDYLTIVKQPMDLGTIKSKIEADKYNTIEDIAFDVRLVWRNCMLYNRDGSEVINSLIDLNL